MGSGSASRVQEHRHLGKKLSLEIRRSSVGIWGDRCMSINFTNAARLVLKISINHALTFPAHIVLNVLAKKLYGITT